MSISTQITKRFGELEEQIMSFRTRDIEGSCAYDTVDWQKWATSVQNLIRAVFGESAPHYVNFKKAYEDCGGWEDQVNALKGIFLAAKADYDGGYVYRLEAVVSGEVYGDFIALSKAALAEGAKDVAAVLACAALEDCLKRFALLNSIDVTNKPMQEVVNALKAKGLVSGAQKSLLDTMPKIRDYAMHANWEKLLPQDVGSVIGFVEQFLLAHFS